MRLYAVAVSDDFDGFAAACNVDPDELPTKRLVNMAWHYISRNGSKEQVNALKANLIRPLPGAVTVSKSVVAAEMSMFEKLRGKPKLGVSTDKPAQTQDSKG